ncbi:MAG: hypothetical protein K0B14_01210 [Anaerolineaceae bacterium]|nr:hypothetical protein [Anaerolineaceae bacterium]
MSTKDNPITRPMKLPERKLTILNEIPEFSRIFHNQKLNPQDNMEVNNQKSFDTSIFLSSLSFEMAIA